MLRCKSAASHPIFNGQQPVFSSQPLGHSVMNPPEETAGVYCPGFRAMVFDNRIPNRRPRRFRQTGM
jgi:hypothetical protein